MTSFISKLLSLTWLGDIADAINGNKTAIGLITLAIYVLQIVPVVFPDIGLPPDIAAKVQKALLYVGVVLTPVGIGHKVVKKIEEKGE
jgi:hypothetical protein